MTEIILNLALIYERVKFRNTGQARIIIGRKNPEKSVNYGEMKKFYHTCMKYDIIPGFYFQTMYDEGRKIIPTKPECKLLNYEPNLYYYTRYISECKADEPGSKKVVESIMKTDENIRRLLQDNDPEHTGKNNGKDFFIINSLKKEQPEWVNMFRLGLISPYLLFVDPALMDMTDYLMLMKNDRKDFNVYRMVYEKLNTGGKMDELLDNTFHYLFTG